jgi:hypothetical protein
MIDMRDSLVFCFVFIEGIEDFYLVEELGVFEVGIFDFDGKLFVGFNAKSFVYLTKCSCTEFFDKFELFSHNCVNHNRERF